MIHELESKTVYLSFSSRLFSVQFGPDQLLPQEEEWGTVSAPAKPTNTTPFGLDHLQPFNNYGDGTLTFFFNSILLLKTLMYIRYSAMQEAWPVYTLGKLYYSVEWTPSFVPPCKRHLKTHWWTIVYISLDVLTF